MTIRAKVRPRRVIHLDLEPGSLFVKDYATQLHDTPWRAEDYRARGRRSFSIARLSDPPRRPKRR